MAASYVELHTHSCWSLREGASSTDELIDRAIQLGYAALALTDHDNLYGAISFYTAARERGIVPILGAEVTALDGAARVVCLVRTMDGYANLCRLLTRRMMDPEVRLAAAVPPLSGGLHILTDDAPMALALRPHVAPAGSPRDPAEEPGAQAPVGRPASRTCLERRKPAEVAARSPSAVRRARGAALEREAPSAMSPGRPASPAREGGSRSAAQADPGGLAAWAPSSPAATLSRRASTRPRA